MFLKAGDIAIFEDPDHYNYVEDKYGVVIRGVIRKISKRKYFQSIDLALLGELKAINGQVLDYSGGWEGLEMLEKATEYNIKRYMSDNYADHTDRFGFMNLTTLVEDACHTFDVDHWLDVENHEVWEWVLEIQDLLFEKGLVNL